VNDLKAERKSDEALITLTPHEGKSPLTFQGLDKIPLKPIDVFELPRRGRIMVWAFSLF
jgi:hypothetical protein